MRMDTSTFLQILGAVISIGALLVSLILLARTRKRDVQKDATFLTEIRRDMDGVMRRAEHLEQSMGHDIEDMAMTAEAQRKEMEQRIARIEQSQHEQTRTMDEIALNLKALMQNLKIPYQTVR